ncbi:MAG: hypothetical protein L6R38_002101 [Xanthoria sp. 2 TBL-2021]|nr:MAG: hypothetical protein L6R38_002101 [Xanthoria sp. 2 TBL-2021]
MTSPPQFFYRVQHQGSYTYYHPHTGFEARGHYKMDPSHYINGSKVRSHLKWADRPIEPTPFISVFDNYEDADHRARFHIQRGDHNVFIAAINAESLRPLLFNLNTADGPVDLQIWQTPGYDTFISILDLKSALRLEPWMGQASEWLAVDDIPSELITLL